MIPRIFFNGQVVPEWLEKTTHNAAGEDRIDGLLTFGSPCLVFKARNTFYVYAPFIGVKIKFISTGYAVLLKPKSNGVTTSNGAEHKIYLSSKMRYILAEMNKATKTKNQTMRDFIKAFIGVSLMTIAACAFMYSLTTIGG